MFSSESAERLFPAGRSQHSWGVGVGARQPHAQGVSCPVCRVPGDMWQPALHFGGKKSLLAGPSGTPGTPETLGWRTAKAVHVSLSSD